MPEQPQHTLTAMEPVTEAELQGLYTWVDEIPLSRPKRNIARDFSDGVLMAEIVHHYFPKLVELHNYSSANSSQQKHYNWSTLNQKVFKRLGFTIPKPDVDAIANCQAGSIERVLKLVKIRIAKFREEGLQPAPLAAPASKEGPSSGYAGGGLGAPPGGVPSGYAAGGYDLPSSAPGPNGPAPQPRSAVAYQGAGMGGAGAGLAGLQQSLAARAHGVHPELLAERDQTIAELKETNEILETKVRKLEQLVRLKDAKISTLMAKLQAGGLA